MCKFCDEYEGPLSPETLAVYCPERVGKCLVDVLAKRLLGRPMTDAEKGVNQALEELTRSSDPAETLDGSPRKEKATDSDGHEP